MTPGRHLLLDAIGVEVPRTLNGRHRRFECDLGSTHQRPQLLTLGRPLGRTLRQHFCNHHSAAAACTSTSP